jgi:hypothetical protein
MATALPSAQRRALRAATRNAGRKGRLLTCPSCKRRNPGAMARFALITAGLPALIAAAIAIAWAVLRFDLYEWSFVVFAVVPILCAVWIRRRVKFARQADWAVEFNGPR